MKDIILFSRSELVHLYGGLSVYLSNEFNVIHVAYSATEKEVLHKNYHINAVIVFKDEIEKLLTDISYNSELINEIDSSIIIYSAERFNLNSSIQSDRALTSVSYHDALKLAQAIYIFWNTLLGSKKTFAIIHEPTSLIINHIAAIVAKKHYALYLNMIMVKSDLRYSFIFVDGDDTNGTEFEHNLFAISSESIVSNLRRINSFVENFSRDNEIFLIDKVTKNRSLFYLAISATIKILKSKLIKPTNCHLVDYIDLYLSKTNEPYKKLINIVSYKARITYDIPRANEKYYYYPLHLEPEAVVLYWGDGIYKGQIKLIENIAAQLPPNTFLYVKDHPHYVGYREVRDYIQLKKVVNIKLIDPNYSGKMLIKSSLGVITINGTAGFEGIVLKKPVYIFGNAFYKNCPQVTRVSNIKDLRKLIYEANEISDENEFYKTILAFLLSCHEGVADYFGGRFDKYDIDPKTNAQNISKAIIELKKRRNDI